LKFLVTGLGSIGQRHVRNLRTLLGDRVEIIAYRSRRLDLITNEDLTAEFGVSPEERYGIKTFTDLDIALAEKPDAALVTNPTSLHIPTALAAAEHGCHLFIEKPLSNSLDGIARLLNIANRQSLIVLVGYQLRFHPALQLIHKMLQDGRIGQVVSARLEFGDYLPGAHPYEDYRTGYAARADLGGGAVLCLIHEIDYAYWFFGIPLRVFALGGHLSELETDVEDTASMLMECALNGRKVPIHVHLDFVQRPPSRTCQIIGDRGTIFWDYYENELRVFDVEWGEWNSHTFDNFQRNQMFLDEMHHFVRCLKGEEQPVVNLRNAIDSLRIALTAKKSMDTGKVEEIQPWQPA